jgi:rfaE bifunctional protein kinase chain/domain/rfaE bifunctional protein nucleotidyltransferase chain/domain
MANSPTGKILLFSDLVDKVRSLQSQGKKIVQSHGVYDLIHPGIVKHLNAAKDQGDILVVTVIRDKHIRRGSGRPIFAENMRAENVSALSVVDFVAVVDDETPFECVQQIKPDIFAKGQAYKERDKKIHEKIFDEERELYFGQSQIYETGGFSFSSSQIINRLFDFYPDDIKRFLQSFSDKYSFDTIVDHIKSLHDLKVLILGDGIIDEYHYCQPMGKSAKANLVVNRYLDQEVFAGGAFAIANHLAGICNQVQLVSLLGKEDSKEDFILKNMKPNVATRFFLRDDAPTIVKKRYVHQYLNQKLFEINYLNDRFLAEEQEKEIISYLENTIPEFDLVLVSDFGHGFISNNIYNCLAATSKVLAINTQTNAANTGYNLITKYGNPNYVCLDEPEVRLAAQDKFGDIESIACRIREQINAHYLVVTRGKKGSIGVDQQNVINRTPIFSTKVIDTVGAGDAFFAFTAPCFARDLPLDLVSFIGNAVGALAVQIVCNKKPVEKHDLLAFINTLLK